MKTIKLSRHERIVAVVPEIAHGPGWTNAPTWIYIEGPNYTFRVESIQPYERSPELHTLFSAGAAMHSALVSAIPVQSSE